MKLKEHPDIYCRFPVTIGWVILLAGNTICFLFFMKVNNTNIFYVSNMAFVLSILFFLLGSFQFYKNREHWSDPLKLHKSEQTDQSVLRGVRG